MVEISLQRSPVVCQRLGQCRSTLHKHVRDGTMPPPIRLGQRWSAWFSEEIDQIVRARVAGWGKDRIRELVRELVARRQTAAPLQGRIGELGDDEPRAVPRAGPKRAASKATRPPQVEG
jgi:prophage regulatory protein